MSEVCRQDSRTSRTSNRATNTSRRGTVRGRPTPLCRPSFRFRVGVPRPRGPSSSAPSFWVRHPDTTPHDPRYPTPPELRSRLDAGCVPDHFRRGSSYCPTLPKKRKKQPHFTCLTFRMVKVTCDTTVPHESVTTRW